MGGVEPRYPEVGEVYEAGVPTGDAPVRFEIGLLAEQIKKHDKLVRRLLDRIGPVTRPSSDDDKIRNATIAEVPDRAHSAIALQVQDLREQLEATTYAIDDVLSRVEV